MKKVLVTGAAGYLGARISKHLAESGHRVTVFDIFEPSEMDIWNSLMNEIIVGDIQDEKTISGLAEKQYDAIIHLISLDHHKSEATPNYISSINVMPTWNLLEKFKNTGLKTFVYFSTFHVYGKVPANIITEEFTLAPMNNYGLTHILSENICNYFNYSSDINCINVRLTNSYGSPIFKENNCWWLVINDLCRTAYKEKEIQLLSDGSSQRDFIHSSDICNAMELLINIEKLNTKNNTFNVSTGNTLTIWELANKVKSIYNKRYNIDLPIVLPDGITEHYAEVSSNKKKYTVDNSKLISLGFSINMTLETGIGEIFDYLENDYEK